MPLTPCYHSVKINKSALKLPGINLIIRHMGNHDAMGVVAHFPVGAESTFLISCPHYFHIDVCTIFVPYLSVCRKEIA